MFVLNEFIFTRVKRVCVLLSIKKTENLQLLERSFISCVLIDSIANEKANNSRHFRLNSLKRECSTTTVSNGCL